MTEMTPRERSEMVRRQSRDYIAALRQERLKRSAKIVSAPPMKVREKAIPAPRSMLRGVIRPTETKAAIVPPALPTGQSFREEAATVRQTSAAALSELRGARRPKSTAPSKRKSANADAPAAAPPAAAKAMPAKPSEAAESVKVATLKSGFPGGFAASVQQSPAPSEMDTSAVPRRLRSKRGVTSERASAIISTGGLTRDIDVISGLGPALKSKLRHSGISTVETLSTQKLEHLREVLGPAGRLVNLEAVVRAAKAACASGAASPGTTPPAPKSAASRRQGG